MRRFLVRTPASCANLGSGFDTLGLALDLTNDAIITVDDTAAAGSVTVESILGEGAEALPLGSENLFVRSMLRYAETVGATLPACRIALTNRIPLSRGLGSSSSAIVGGLTAAAVLLGKDISDPGERLAILRLADEIEGHADNVAAALYGGLTIAIRPAKGGTDGQDDPDGLHAHRLSPSKDIAALVVIPSDELSTAESRRGVPQQVALTDAVYNISCASSLVAGLLAGDAALIRDGAHDRLHQPHRMPLLPYFERVRAAGLECGIDNLVLSGAGPSMLSLVGIDQVDASASALRTALGAEADRLTVRKLSISEQGVTVTAVTASSVDSLKGPSIDE